MTVPVHVLLIDDDPSHLKLYGWILERRSFVVHKALVGSTSVKLPQPGTPVDVVVMDYRLRSSLDAGDVAELVKKNFPGVPIIVLSELPFIPEAARSFASGFVTKGEPDELVTMVTATSQQVRKAG